MNNIILSFFAGLILNVMPCILPIMLIKIYDIVKYSQTLQNKKNLKIISLSTTLGIIFIFSIFSIINILFKHAGKAFNLGFHFQNPYFLIIVIFLLFLFFLNLLNFFDIHYPTRIINFIQKKYEGSKKLNKGIFIENFLTAIFMVLFATPCSLPIIGTVATFSLTNDSYLYIFYNFLAMGLGMATPFILILFYPNLLNFLRNKQKLLHIIHNIIIVSIFLTIIWLLYILYTNIGLKPTIILLCFMTIIPIQFRLVKKSLQRLILVSFITISGTILTVRIFKEDIVNKMDETVWKTKITQEEIQKYIQDGKTVFINITAKWCMICNLNNITVFSNYDVMNYLSSDDIIAVKLDITKSNNIAENFYENPNSIYIPKYIIFNKQNTNGCSFGGQISHKDFFKELEKCKNKEIKN